MTIDPAALSDAERKRSGVVRLPGEQPEAIAALHNSSRLRAILGGSAVDVDVMVAVRRLEHQQYAGLAPSDLADKFRMAWSV